VHLFYMIGFQNRLLVLTCLAFSFVTHGRRARLIAAIRFAGHSPDRPTST